MVAIIVIQENKSQGEDLTKMYKNGIFCEK